MSSTATQHGGQEATILSTQMMLQHHGHADRAARPIGYEGQSGTDKYRGGSPYGMTLLTGSDGSRWPDEDDLAGARFQGKRVGRDHDQAARLRSSAHWGRCGPPGSCPSREICGDSGSRFAASINLWLI